jgi:hypothetical protein
MVGKEVVGLGGFPLSKANSRHAASSETVTGQVSGHENNTT